MNNDFVVDEIYGKEPPKKIKSKNKGKRGELGVVEILNKRFEIWFKEHPTAGAFSRNQGSGNRWGQNVRLSASAKQIYTGDLACPDGCRWVIESKNGYDDIDLFTCFKGKNCGLDAFFIQVTNDAKRDNRHPLLIWQKTRMPRVAFVPKNIFDASQCTTKLYYQEWVGVLLAELLEQTPDSFWFDAS